MAHYQRRMSRVLDESLEEMQKNALGNEYKDVHIDKFIENMTNLENIDLLSSRGLRKFVMVQAATHRSRTKRIRAGKLYSNI